MRHALTASGMLARVAVAWLLVSCRSNPATAAAPPPSAVPSAPAQRALSFRADILPVLTRDCATAKGCHGPERTDSVDLDLRPNAAYDELVGHAADARSGALRVKPGDPDASFLVDKLTGRLNHDEGKRMPLDAKTGTPIEPNPLDSAYIEGVLAQWIRAGAKND